MKQAQWFFDFISPFAYLQHEHFHKLPSDIEITCKPLLFAGLLSHWGHKGPAEIPQKRVFTYQHVHWLARHLGIPFRCPPEHPFNPLKILRLAIALDNNAEVIRTIFRFIWKDGNSINEDSWRQLTQILAVDNADELILQPAVKSQLHENGKIAVAHGVFGVPTFLVDGHLFWGFDASDMFIDYLHNPDMFNEEEMVRLSDLPVGASRK